MFSWKNVLAVNSLNITFKGWHFGILHNSNCIGQIKLGWSCFHWNSYKWNKLFSWVMKALVNTEKLQLIPPNSEPLPAVIQINERTEANLKIAPVIPLLP